MNILVVDGQGGGVGKALIEKMRAARIEANITGVGTNSMATSALLKAGADLGATGENAIMYNSRYADIIVGGIGIVCANSMMGEISPAIATAVSESDAIKLLVPLNRCNIRISGAGSKPLSVRIEETVRDIQALVEELKKEGHGNRRPR